MKPCPKGHAPITGACVACMGDEIDRCRAVLRRVVALVAHDDGAAEIILGVIDIAESAEAILATESP